MDRDDVVAALNDTKVKQVVQKHVAKENIKLLRRDSLEPVFRRELSLIGEKGERAVNESPGGVPDLVDDIEPEDALVDVNPSAENEIRHSVKEYQARRQPSDL